MNTRKKLIRITTVASSMNILLRHQLRFMSQHYDITAVSAPGKYLDEVREREGVKVMPLKMTRSITPLEDLKALFTLYRFLKKEKPLIVHTHTPKAGLLGMFAGKLAGVPIRMHTVAGMPLLEVSGAKRKLLDMVEKFTSACATKVYPNSKGLLDIMLKHGYATRSKLGVIGNGSSNGIDTRYFSKQNFSQDELVRLRSELGFSENDVVFCFVGRIVTDKGMNELMQAFSKLHNANARVRLLIVGDYEKELDPVLPETEQIVKTHPAIKWVGWQNDVRPYLAVSDVFVFPSYREGFPQVVMQAAALELPCLVTNINGCNEVIKDGVNGLIIPVKDEHALYAAMDRLASDAVFRTQLAMASREMIVKDYEQNYLWNEILKEYRLMEERHSN